MQKLGNKAIKLKMDLMWTAILFVQIISGIGSQVSVKLSAKQ